MHEIGQEVESHYSKRLYIVSLPAFTQDPDSPTSQTS